MQPSISSPHSSPHRRVGRCEQLQNRPEVLRLMLGAIDPRQVGAHALAGSRRRQRLEALRGQLRQPELEAHEVLELLPVHDPSAAVRIDVQDLVPLVVAMAVKGPVCLIGGRLEAAKDMHGHVDELDREPRPLTDGHVHHGKAERNARPQGKDVREQRVPRALIVLLVALTTGRVSIKG